MGTPSKEVELGQANLIAFNRAQAHWSTKGAVEEADGCVLCAGGSWLPVVANSAFRTGPAVEGSVLIAHAESFFGGFARGFSVKVRDTGEDDGLRDALQAAGLEQFGSPVPQMLILGPLPDHKGVDGVVVERVADEASVADCVGVNAEAYATYGMPAEVLPELFDNAAALVDDPAAHVVVARRDGVAVATAMIFESDGVASVQWVGTVSSARGSGLGTLVTTVVTNVAFERGATSVTLQASPMGEPIYRALGYETVYRYSEFVRWPKPPTSS
ncbi:MAG TPA: GNAT family N-acetyltransferase [Acidimicrobiales bacterium]|nr:GNAT family N-acetyltransferase [Acidimicrobiales bacterium]